MGLIVEEYGDAILAIVVALPIIALVTAVLNYVSLF